MAAVPMVSLLTAPLRSDPTVWIETAWTWWMPYLGYYVLGYALRDVVAPHREVWVLGAVALGGSFLLSWQWHNAGAVSGALETYTPAESYYSPTVIAVADPVFPLARALVRPSGTLRWLSNGRRAATGRRLGAATLGVFAIHLLVLELVLRLPVVGGDDAPSAVTQLGAPCVLVFGVSYAIALGAARVPHVRQIF